MKYDKIRMLDDIRCDILAIGSEDFDDDEKIVLREDLNKLIRAYVNKYHYSEKELKATIRNATNEAKDMNNY